MNTFFVAFCICAVLTLAFAFALLMKLFAKPTQARADVETRDAAARKVVTMGGNTEQAKALAEAMSTILKALGDFGAQIDKLGPVAILGVFLIFFTLCMLSSGWILRSP